MKIVNNLNAPITYYLKYGSGSGFVASGYLLAGDVAQYDFDYKIGADRQVPIYGLQVYMGQFPATPPKENHYFANVPVNATFEIASTITTPMFGPFSGGKGNLKS